MNGQIAAEKALNFILAGKSTVTLVSKGTGTRFTYKVNRPNAQSPHFVRLLNGADNRSNYSYMGRISTGQYIHDRRNRAGTADSPSAKGFRWVLYRLLAGENDLVDEQVEIWHSGKCGKCGRKLTVPASIEAGIGPVCAGKNVAPMPHKMANSVLQRDKNVIKNAKPIQKKAGKCVVTPGHNDQTFTVKSPSGAKYSVEVKNDAAYCTCEWGSYRPGSDQRCGCSHGQAALDFVESKVGRKLSVWTDQADADRQHRPARHVGDGTIVTSRLKDTAKKIESIVATPAAEWAAGIAWKAKLAAQEMEQDQTAEETKMAVEVSDLTMVAKLAARSA